MQFQLKQENEKKLNVRIFMSLQNLYTVSYQ
jgi:hypothetical protein